MTKTLIFDRRVPDEQLTRKARAMNANQIVEVQVSHERGEKSFEVYAMTAHNCADQAGPFRYEDRIEIASARRDAMSVARDWAEKHGVKVTTNW